MNVDILQECLDNVVFGDKSEHRLRLEKRLGGAAELKQTLLVAESTVRLFSVFPRTFRTYRNVVTSFGVLFLSSDGNGY